MRLRVWLLRTAPITEQLLNRAATQEVKAAMPQRRTRRELRAAVRHRRLRREQHRKCVRPCLNLLSTARF